MRKFIIKIASFLLIMTLVLLALNVLVSKFKPYHYSWGNPMFQEKLIDVNTYANLDVFFIGSSHFYRQINPSQFDLITETKSYNLGVQALATPENYYLLEEFMSDNKFDSATVFLALSDLQSIAPKNFYNTRSTYFIGNKIIKQSLAIISDEQNFSFKTRSFRYFSFVSNYLYNSLGLTGLRTYLRNKDNYQGDFGFKLNKGFVSLDDEEGEDLVLRQTNFNNELFKFDKRVKRTKQEYIDSKSNGGRYNLSHSEIILELIGKTKSRNIDLIFIIPPRKDNYKSILNLVKVLPINSVIDLADPIKFPEFYSLENSFDIGHLNKKGAKIFTQKLAEEYLKIKNL